jgi:hypothetical protein
LRSNIIKVSKEHRKTIATVFSFYGDFYVFRLQRNYQQGGGVQVPAKIASNSTDVHTSILEDG